MVKIWSFEPWPKAQPTKIKKNRALYKWPNFLGFSWAPGPVYLKVVILCTTIMCRLHNNINDNIALKCRVAVKF